MKSSETKYLSRGGKKKRVQFVQIDTRVNSEKVSLSQALMVVRIIFMQHFFQVSFGQSFHLPGSESVFGISEGLPTCAHSSLNQDAC